ncbi:hypothetical protein DXG01_014304 [Tephrocybe rancida]|nr:hypothetical protein DXG01_014304 [Tephrocybe rancida]
MMQGNELTISTAFTAIALFNMVRTPLNIILTWIVQIIQAGVALNHITMYLNKDEVSEQVSSLKKDTSQPLSTAPSAANSTEEEEGLGIEKGSFKWNEVKVLKANSESADNAKDGKTRSAAITVGGEMQALLGEGMSDALLPEVNIDHRFELRDINVRFPKGKLSVIMGPTTSRKTALLIALLGKMTLLPSTLPGKLIMTKSPSKLNAHSQTYSLSYATQVPWLRHQTIRDNILFGAPFDSMRYNAVLHACALRTDLNVLEDRDLTEISACGVSLSGGQKVRVALARAVHSHVRGGCLAGGLWCVSFSLSACHVLALGGEGDDVQILVMHHVDLVLPAAHYFMHMLDGQINTQGTIKDLRAQGVLKDLTHNSAITVAETEVQEETLTPTSSDNENADVDKEEATKVKAGKEPRKLVKDEHCEIGGVKSYWIWEVDPTSSHILIDGINIPTISIHDLSSRLTFIPQDATLFFGTLRKNLDPFNEHADAKFLDVLQCCHMISSPSASRSASLVTSLTGSRATSIHGRKHEDTAESIPTNASDVETKPTVSLETQVSAGGIDFSQGQRQFIAMTQALLR